MARSDIMIQPRDGIILTYASGDTGDYTVDFEAGDLYYRPGNSTLLGISEQTGCVDAPLASSVDTEGDLSTYVMARTPRLGG